jgi:nucleoid-associated protein YgaU
MTATLTTTALRNPPRARRQRVRRPSAATYRRRRAIVGTITAAIAAVGILATHDVLAGSGGVPASAAAGLPAHERVSVIAQPGDSLWTIASEYHGDASLTRYLDTLVDLNGGATIQVGQAIVLP